MSHSRSVLSQARSNVYERRYIFTRSGKRLDVDQPLDRGARNLDPVNKLRMTPLGVRFPLQDRTPDNRGRQRRLKLGRPKMEWLGDHARQSK